MQFAVINLPLLASAVTSLGFPDRLAAALEGYPASRWTRAVAAYLGGEYAAAADVLHEIGALPDEAEARLRAAGRLLADGSRGEALEQLELAQRFYTSVSAHRRLEECATLLTV
jgi:thioredoxin-like negative regulator of GroEL